MTQAHTTPSARSVAIDVERLWACLEANGAAIVPLDVAYAMCAMTTVGVQKIFTAKQRSYDKPSGMLGDVRLSRELHIMDDWKHDLVDALVAKDGIPFSVVAPYREEHPMFARVEPFVMKSSSMAGTLDMLLNAGVMHDEIASQAWARQAPVFGSSVNTSLSGSNYRYEDIDEAVREAADIYFDYGTSRYENDEGHSSTIIDFRRFTVVRKGVIYDQVESAFARRGVRLEL
jgi:tRNA A37 threonylcarbamoyladenosine synthetase subunit TsaC/SUA5/YrdC